MNEPVLAVAPRAWIERATGLRVASARRLPGGTHADTYLVEGDGSDAVLRMFPSGDTAAHREIRALSVLDGLDGLCPRVLAGDADGEACGRPATLISRLRGGADVTPGDPEAWAAGLGRTLARIHVTPVALLRGLPLVRHKSGGQQRVVSGPAASLLRADWERLYAGPEVLTHFDFWSGNVLWTNGSVSGVVDWSGASLGPPAFDLGWCRLDLVLLYDERIADVLADAYASELGTASVDTRLADLWAVARSHAEVETWDSNYVDLGRGDLNGAELRERHDAWTARLIARRRDDLSGKHSAVPEASSTLAPCAYRS